MSALARLQRLDALFALFRHFSVASTSTRFAEALDALMAGTASCGAIAYSQGEGKNPIAARGLTLPLADDPAPLSRALAQLCECALEMGVSRRVDDLELEYAAISAAAEPGARAARSAYAAPVLAAESKEGALLLLFADPTLLDPETVRFIDSVVAALALTLERDRGREAEIRFRDDLTETGRMATLGLYTASVAHELRGPAGALVLQHEELRGIVDRLGLQAGPDSVVRGCIAELTEVVCDMGVAVDRIRETVSQLTTIGRRETAPTPVRLADVVRESLAIARPHLDRRGVVLCEEIDRGCFTLGRRDNLGQVVLNLVFNAADAAQVASPPRVWVRVAENAADVLLIVEDNGPGVPPESVSDIFKSFYTTKPRGKGTGLGLKICSDVVAAHGGHIEVDERVGGGACFRVVLPRSAPAARSAPPPPNLHASAVAPLARLRVLVVDDDPIFSRTLRRALRPHDVRTAGTAADAEIALLDPKYEPDIVLCDVLLPGRNGNVLHARLCERRPDIASRFVFVTGGALAKAEADYLRASGCRTLFKPVDLRMLNDVMQHSAPESSGAVRTLVHSDIPSY